MKIKLCHCCCLSLLLGFAVSPAPAYEPNVQKLFAASKTPQTMPQFGSAVALNDRWLLSGEPNNDEPATDAGAVHVFDAVTGRLVRVLRGEGKANDLFGTSVAVSGNLAIVGALKGNGAQNDSGTAFVYDLTTGALVRKLAPANGKTDDRFGAAVGLEGNFAVVGAPQRHQTAVDSGVAYVMDIRTGAVVQTLVGADTAAADLLGGRISVESGLALVGARGADPGGAAYLFDIRYGTPLHKLSAPNTITAGEALALSGRWALVGDSKADDKGAESGAVLVFDTVTGLLVDRFTPKDAAAGDHFGHAIAMNGRTAVISSPGKNTNGLKAGAAYVFDIPSGEQFAFFEAPDAQDSVAVGNDVAFFGQTAVIGSDFDSQLGTRTGAVYLLRPIVGPEPFGTLAVTKAFAPGTVGARYTSFANPVTNSEGEVLFMGGISAGNRRGIWSTLSTGQTVDLLLSTNEQLNVPGLTGATVSGLSKPLCNQPDVAYFQASLTGSGVTAANNAAIFSEDGTSIYPVLRLGKVIPALNNAALGRFLQVVQTTKSMGSKALTVACQLRNSGAGAVTPASDTGLLWISSTNMFPHGLREGQSAGLDNLGQFTRCSVSDDKVAFTAGLQGSAQLNQALYEYDPAADAEPIKLAQRGAPAPNTGGALFGSFLAENLSLSEDVSFKATYSGSGVTSANNLSLWSERFGSPKEIVREGDGAMSLTGVTWSNFGKFWSLLGDRVLFVATLKGTGITAANDTVLVLANEISGFQFLLREGDPAPGCGGARIGNLQNVVAESENNWYAIQASLTGVPAGTNQALFIGSCETTMAKEALRRPFLALRKGQPYRAQTGTVARIRSLLVSNAGFDSTGAGAKGLGQPINDSGLVVLTVTLDNGSTQVITCRQ